TSHSTAEEPRPFCTSRRPADRHPIGGLAEKAHCLMADAHALIIRESSLIRFVLWLDTTTTAFDLVTRARPAGRCP
ncbi:hypothetical protein ACIP98_40275, partial [Streptomyces sp. NPDC088354]|uniref:hypothetical protein n=1 Tax=Streptomyces sp. NPDC088354 TaxID=3365856 RepID=UPI00382FE11B